MVLLPLPAAAGRVECYYNDKKGGFSPGVNITTTALGANMVIGADFNNDGNIDVAYVALNDGRATVHMSEGGEGIFSAGIDVASNLNSPT